MDIPVTDAKGQLTELVRKAEAGEEVVLTRHGQPVVKLVPIREAPSVVGRLAAIKAARKAGPRAAAAGASAARSQDWLYDAEGMPQ